MKDEKQPFFSHLKELRSRIIVCMVALGLAFILTFSFKEQIFHFLMLPFTRVMPAGSSFIFIGVTEAFITYFKISVVAALFVAAPVILYEIWMFVAPGLYEKEKRYVFPFIIFGSISFAAGALFCYFAVMPSAYRFFVSYAADFIIPMPDLKSYMSLTLRLLIIFGIMFEMPLVAYYLAKAGVINTQLLKGKRRYAILGIFIVSAMITPPDVMSQLLMALPLWGLYEVCIIITRFSGKKVTVHEKD